MTANGNRDDRVPQVPSDDESPSDTQRSDTETRHATNYSPSSARETAQRQAAPQSSAATDDDEIDDVDVEVLPGTGGPDDQGDVRVDDDDLNLPTG